MIKYPTEHPYKTSNNLHTENVGKISSVLEFIV